MNIFIYIYLYYLQAYCFYYFSWLVSLLYKNINKYEYIDIFFIFYTCKKCIYLYTYSNVCI